MDVLVRVYDFMFTGVAIPVATIAILLQLC